MRYVHIAVLMTCHNRRDTTLACLDALFKQELPNALAFEVYLVDDGSKDGTGEAVIRRYPSVRVIKGSGNLYWCGGMRLAWTEAMKKNYDYYLWLNDDTVLFAHALSTLIVTAQTFRDRHNCDSIVVGSVMEPTTGLYSYGGSIQIKQHSLNLRNVIPTDSIQECDTFNGNLVLIPRQVAYENGNLCTHYTHAIGDTDYGLRARMQGIPIRVAPKYLGQCKGNPRSPWTDPQIPLIERIKYLYSPKGLPPREWRIFTKQHYGKAWPLYFIKVHLRVIFPKVWMLLGK